MSKRYNIAIEILQGLSSDIFHFLGIGKSSVVFHNNLLVYKVFILDDVGALSYKRHLINTLKSLGDKFDNSKFFYPIHQIIEINNNRFLLIYPYEKSKNCSYFEADEIQDFLVECWQKRLIFQDIKPENFIRVNGELKWIDYEPDKFTDNLFLNMVARAFIYSTYSNKNASFLNKLCRSAINQFDLPELSGLQAFTNRLYTKIIFAESQSAVLEKNLLTYSPINDLSQIEKKGLYRLPYSNDFNAASVFWHLLKKGIYLNKIDFDTPVIDTQNYFSPKSILIHTEQLTAPLQKVSLIIKACIQDAEIVSEAVQHIVKQLAFPNSFDEKILALDIRQNDFLRTFNTNNTWIQLLSATQKLLDAGIVDKVIYPSRQDIISVNQKWFGAKTDRSHTFHKIPVSAPLFAFEQAQNDYILQMDCDVMIGRLSKKHSFLNDMISAFEKAEQVLSVGFNIYKGEEENFTPYFGFENGGFVPEVRFCLLKKSRIQKLLPLANETLEDGFKWSWYRALELKQKENNDCSIRGGDSRSFYIHPQNFKKTEKDFWFTTIDRIEQLQIPEKQINEFDLAGSYYDWALPKRKENLVIISCFRNLPLSRFLRFWYSLISQTHQDWGLILIDDASENGIAPFIRELTKPFHNQITFIQNRFSVGVAKNTYKAIHYFMPNQESIVCIIDADDALIGKNALKNIYEKYTYWGADLVIGKMYRTDKLSAQYKYTPNFTQPRLYGGNVWQHIRSFRKYLFDSLDFNDLKIKNPQSQMDDILLSRRFSQKMIFPEYCWDFTYMVPITEMSENPMWINHFNIFHDRTTIPTPKIKQIKDNTIAEILAKPKKSAKDVFKGRKKFIPNLHKIEIDITYECNLKCINCNRSSTQAPIKEGMSLEAIQKFIWESIALYKKWELINLLGGEPTIHKDFLEIVNLILNNYIATHSPETILQITTNGYGSVVQNKLAQLPQHPNLLIDDASFKEERVVPYFSPFNDAPIDHVNANHEEYYKGCWVTSYCGIGLNQLGYYPCGVAGGIDRVLEFRLGVPSLKEVDESISNLLDTFCRYCGNFKDYAPNQGDFIPRQEKAALTKPIISETWKKAYKKYNGK